MGEPTPRSRLGARPRTGRHRRRRRLRLLHRRDRRRHRRPHRTVEDATAALIGLVDELGSSGAVEEHLARDLEHGTDEVVRALEQGDAEKVMDALGGLQDKVDKGLDKGEISAADAQRLNDAIQGVASAVSAGGDQSGGEDGGGNGGDEG